jgi:hypothetical protein
MPQRHIVAYPPARGRARRRARLRRGHEPPGPAGRSRGRTRCVRGDLGPKRIRGARTGPVRRGPRDPPRSRRPSVSRRRPARCAGRGAAGRGVPGRVHEDPGSRRGPSLLGPDAECAPLPAPGLPRSPRRPRRTGVGRPGHRVHRPPGRRGGRPVPVLDGDDEETLHARIQEAEHRLYPAVVGAMLERRVRVDGRRVRVEEPVR